MKKKGKRKMIINDKYSLESVDTLNIVLYEHGVVKDKKSKNFGKPTKTTVGYFPNVEKALNFLIDKEINGTGLKDLKLIVSAIKDVKEMVKGVVFNE